MIDLAAQALGCAVFPAGVGQTELQVQTIADLKPVCYAGTPSFLKIILEKADEMKADVSQPEKGGGQRRGVPAHRASDARGSRHRRLPSYGTADLGLIAYETEAREGLVVDEGVIVEIVRPGTGDPVAAGEVGEVVVTTLTPEYPLIRFAHRRLVGRAARHQPLRAHQHAHQGLDGSRGPDDQSQRHVRASVAGGRGRQTPSRDSARSTDGDTRRRQERRMTPAVRDATGPPRRSVAGHRR